MEGELWRRWGLWEADVSQDERREVRVRGRERRSSCSIAGSRMTPMQLRRDSRADVRYPWEEVAASWFSRSMEGSAGLFIGETGRPVVSVPVTLGVDRARPLGGAG